MTVIIEIHYAAASREYQKGSFQLRGRKPVSIAYDWWKHIKKELSYRAELEKVIVEGDQDITELVLYLEKQEQLKTFNDAENLPF